MCPAKFRLNCLFFCLIKEFNLSLYLTLLEFTWNLKPLKYMASYCVLRFILLYCLLLLLLWLFWSIHDHIVTPNISKYKIWTFDFVLQNTLLLCCIGNYYQLCVDCKSLSFWTGQLEYTFESWSVKVHCFFHLAYYEIFPYPHAQKFFFQESENLCQRIQS